MSKVSLIVKVSFLLFFPYTFRSVTEFEAKVKWDFGFLVYLLADGFQ